MLAHNLSKALSRALVFAFCIALLCTMFSGTASAQFPNKETTLTFSGPVEIPGVDAQVLPAGTYVFKLLDSSSDRHIVQVESRMANQLEVTMATAKAGFFKAVSPS